MYENRVGVKVWVALWEKEKNQARSDLEREKGEMSMSDPCVGGSGE